MIDTRSRGNTSGNRSTCIVGIGGAGSAAASAIAKDLRLPIDAVLIDRDSNDLRGHSTGTKIAVGYPMYSNRRNNGLTDGELVDETDILRVRSAISGYTRTYVLMGLGGKAGQELAPSVISTAASVGSKVIVICTVPFSFEGPMRRKVAEDTLRKLADAGCPVAVVDADAALSATASVGNVAGELAQAQARAVMTLLTVDNNSNAGALNGAGVTLDMIAQSRNAFISHGAANSVEEIRRATRDAVRSPLTSGLALCQATMVGVTISAPSDLPVKTLNAVMAAIERELSPDAQVATTFVPLPEHSTKVRVSIIAGDTRVEETPDGGVDDDLDGLDFDDLEPNAAVEAAERALAARHEGMSTASSNGHRRGAVSALL